MTSDDRSSENEPEDPLGDTPAQPQDEMPAPERIDMLGEQLGFDDAKEFIGPRYDWYWAKWKGMAGKKTWLSWNWAAAIGGIWWMGFRKMTRTAKTGIVILVIALLLAGTSTGGVQENINAVIAVVPVVWILVFGTTGNYLYWRHVAKTIGTFKHLPNDQARRQAADAAGDLSIGRGIITGFGAYLAGAIALAAGIGISAPTAPPAPPAPVCAIASVKQSAEMFFVNNDFDAGWRVNTTVQNKGAARTLLVEVILSSSEGDFVRRQTLRFQENQRFDLTFEFHEPTINADNIQARAACSAA